MKVVAFFKLPSHYELDTVEESETLQQILNDIGFSCYTSDFNGYDSVTIEVDDYANAIEVIEYINILKHSPIDDNVCNTKYIEIITYDSDDNEDLFCKIESLQSSIHSLQTQLDIFNYYYLEELNRCDDSLQVLDEAICKAVAIMEKDGILYYRETMETLIKIIEDNTKLNLSDLKKAIFKQEQ